LSRILRQSETLTELFDDALCLFLLFDEREDVPHRVLETRFVYRVFAN
jgi:hypothetical protein